MRCLPFRFKGSVTFSSYKDQTDKAGGELLVIAKSVGDRINGYIAVDDLTLQVVIGMDANGDSEVKAANLEGEMTVSLGFADETTGRVHIGINDGNLSLKTFLKLGKHIHVNDAFTLTEGAFDLKMSKTGDRTTVSVAIKAEADITYSPDHDPITLASSGTFDSATGDFSFSASTDSMIHDLFGLEVLSVGHLGE